MNLKKILLCGAFTCFAGNLYADATLVNGDTMYYFAKACNSKGKTAYANTGSNWQAYSQEEVYQEYKYMLDMTELNTWNSPQKITRKDILDDLSRTRQSRLKSAIKQKALICN